jgi:hypothetical protein
MKKRVLSLSVTVSLGLSTVPVRVTAQESGGALNSQQSSPVIPGSYADGPFRSGAIPAGTRFVIELEDSLDTKDDRAGKPFAARTVDTLATVDGRELPAGSLLRGHIDKCESAHEVGRARLWLTFDNLASPRGRLPLVAQLIDAPGVHSVRVAYDHEGEILAASSKRDQAELAAAVGALTGAAAGVASRNARHAATGAAIGALTAFLITSGLGQEVALPKETKLELVLARPLLLYPN